MELVIRGGMIVDGTGDAPFQADVGISGGVITAIGQGLRGATEIDAAGKIVTPGFVDIHTHYDGQITWENRLLPSSNHGVTTVLMGNCAIGIAPVRAGQRELLLQVIAGVEDIPEPVMAAGVPWAWETFPEYLDFLETRESDVDFAAQLPHGALRVYVMGERGANREPPTTPELGEMTRLVREAIEAGAFGVSTSRTIVHRRLDGALAPTETSGEAELLAIARGVGQAGRGVLELIADFDDIALGGTAEFEMLKRMAKLGNCPLSFTLVQDMRQPDAWRHLLALAEQANRDGYRIKGQVAPRAVGMCFGLDLSLNPFSFTAGYREIADLPLAERVAQLRDPARRARILGETPEHSNQYLIFLTSLYANTFPMLDKPDYEPNPAGSVRQRAAAAGVSPAELAYDLLLEDEGRRMLYLPITNFLNGTLSVVREMMASPATVVALGDGGAHYGLICDASYPSFVLSHWVRDRIEGRFPLQQMVRALTWIPASTVGFDDRGLIKLGMKADLNVIDMDEIGLAVPELRYDLPGGGKRLVQRSTGYDATIVSGIVTYRKGQPTGALPGRLVRSKAERQAAAA
jgi:N-acyl-D-aspartate/D-glutamate deacylase